MKYFSLLFLTLFSFGCSHKIRIKNPVHHFLTAESQGKSLKGGLSLYLINGSEYTLDLKNEKTDNPLKASGGNTDFLAYGVTGELGIYGPLDFFYISGGSMGTATYGAKLQVLGDSKNQAAEKNLSISLISGYGKEVHSNSEGEDFELFTQDDDSSVDTTISKQTLGTLISYRTSKRLIFNSSYLYIQHNFYGKIESENINLDAKNINYHGNSHILTIGAKYHFLPHRFVSGIEIANENTKWNRGTDEFQHIHFNINAGFSW